MFRVLFSVGRQIKDYTKQVWKKYLLKNQQLLGILVPLEGNPLFHEFSYFCLQKLP